ncbi:dihydrolipoyl dehydrogenase [Sporosarcina sp. P37]|uniref:dihydrolipoyl dehydrogenase n=1 Tax=unclassified Sporosarcina TaxID=2647733 RepID=UPI0009BF11DB|nr:MULTISPECIES: dihydrolipoyl dehydrogenase [unclassified Sporosarcina]ARD46973.1 dihydrolipoyl dehydrogenase [Sporosarcina sp. P33]ARK23498.1 dihydrolipoyl dehydrogenase [Sporosarcina sp. P37]PID17653.1 dihydrolipoyl dehydrogenase [Sporosarcina sp. P35]
MQKFDVTVIGAGPGGYVAAIRAAQSGKKVALIEKNKLGGTCLNVGCIPSKALLQHSEVIQTINQANEWGITTGEVSIDFPKLMKRKDQVVTALVQGIQYLVKKNEITLFHGTASVNQEQIITVNEQQLQTENLIVSTGSRPFVPPIPGLEQVDYLTTDTFFDIQKLPASLVIIGGGVIAIELAFAMAPLGTKVTVIEAADDILMTEDADARKIIRQRLQELHVDVLTNAKIEHITKEYVLVKDKRYPFDHLLVATGRTPTLDAVTELKLDLKEGYISVNERYETSVKNVYAIGDVIGGYQLAHAASAEGLTAILAILEEDVHPLDQSAIPRCVYTQPEIASFGLNEKDAAAKGYQVRTSFSPLSANGRALAMGETEGFIKIIAEETYGEILGAVIVASNATELIHEAAVLKHAEGTMHELANFVHAHPTVSEAIGESANAFFGRAIHQ